MRDVFICDYVRTPIGRYGGALSSVRADDLAAHPVKALIARNGTADWDSLDEVILGATNQAGEDNRNLARMVVLLAGLPISVAGQTINRLCASGMDAVISGARAIQTGDADFIIAGGAESMSRAPMVMPKADTAFSRNAEVFDTTIGWRFPNAAIESEFGTEAMPETAENVAEDWGISRLDQDKFALSSQQRTQRAQMSGRLAQEIVPIMLQPKRGDPVVVERDEHPRATTLEKLSGLRAPFRAGGTVTA
ncbi:MAG: beta-ketoacyl synthase N-terminal-like domain-containing protein, partial [Litoreibacter sp.]